MSEGDDEDNDKASDAPAEAPAAAKKAEEEGSPISMRDVELEPVSLHEIEMILAPGRAPPKLNESGGPPKKGEAPRKRLPSVPRRPLPAPTATPAATTKPKYEPDSDSGTLDLKELAREMAPEAPPPKRASIPDAELANLGTGIMGSPAPLPLEPPLAPPIELEEPKPRPPLKAPVKKRPAASTATEAVSEPPPPSKRASTRPSLAAVAKAPERSTADEPREGAGGSKTLWLVLGGAALLGIGFFIGRQTSSPPPAPDTRAAATAPSPTASTAACAPLASATTVATQTSDVLASAVPSAEPVASTASASATLSAALVPTTTSTTPPTTTTTTTAPTGTATMTSTGTAPPVKSSAAPAATGPFDKAAANAALNGLVGSASACKQPGDPSGSATVMVTFAPSGRVTTTSVSGPPFQGTATGGCIARAFKAATVPPFLGDPTTVSKTVNIR